MSDLYGEREQQSYEGIWPSLNKFLLVLILITLAVPIGYSFIPEVRKTEIARARIMELNAKIDEERVKLAHLQRKESLLRNDPEYVATIARDGLDLMDSGETIYRHEQKVAPKSSGPSGQR